MESAVAAACSRVLCPFVVNLKAESSHAATLMVTWDIPCYTLYILGLCTAGITLQSMRGRNIPFFIS